MIIYTDQEYAKKNWKLLPVYVLVTSEMINGAVKLNELTSNKSVIFNEFKLAFLKEEQRVHDGLTYPLSKLHLPLFEGYPFLCKYGIFCIGDLYNGDKFFKGMSEDYSLLRKQAVFFYKGFIPFGASYYKGIIRGVPECYKASSVILTKKCIITN